ncbi:hypothetical protein, partial [Burkholderia cenocepacia]|uniref:hypothetical protein n=1 Tax=Burkholderia cenocepacia TaxID=95486 RepID=UPI001C4E154E
SNSYVNLKIATCLVRYADDRLIDQRFPSPAGAGTDPARSKRLCTVEEESAPRCSARTACPIRER